MFIQTFIKKHDGSPVFVDFEGVRYIFQPNQLGDAVCYVGNHQHAERLLLMGPETYKEYTGMAQHGHKPQAGMVQQLGPDAQRSDLPPPGFTDITDVDEEMEAEETATIPAEDVTKIADLPPADKARVEADHKAVVATDSEKKKEEEVSWPANEVKAKIHEFKFLPPDNFKEFVEANRAQIATWPKKVKTAVAKKLKKQWPDHDPEIEGFKPDDYLGS